jgi:hypothetical protein
MQDWGRTLAEAGIESFKAAIIDTNVKRVDEPSGRKDVEVAFERDGDWQLEEGQAYGVYRDYDDDVLHIDWTDERDRTTIEMDNILDMTESRYYEDGRDRNL